jgi:anti-sigma factor RsiW
MNVTRDVVKDLLVVYLAGEASADTRALVEGWLRDDPDLARQVEAARGGDLPPVALPAPSVEARALDRTRRHFRLRAAVLGAAIYFTTLPLTVTFGSSGFRGLLIDDWLGRGLALGVAAILWWTYIVLSRRVRASGL